TAGARGARRLSTCPTAASTATPFPTSSPKESPSETAAPRAFGISCWIYTYRTNQVDGYGTDTCIPPRRPPHHTRDRPARPGGRVRVLGGDVQQPEAERLRSFQVEVGLVLNADLLEEMRAQDLLAEPPP